MTDDKTQRAAFEFLRQHLQSQETFTREDLAKATGWTKPGTLNTYLNKQYKGLLERVGSEHYRVTDAFWKFTTWPKFKNHVTQVRRVVTSYEPRVSEVLIYDFLMPLTNEEHLRMVLDSLFYRDRILARLQTVDYDELKQECSLAAGSTREDCLDSILGVIDECFQGYSISHVSGRFRSGRLRTQDDVGAILKQGERYLIDETTAVARFVFPYEGNRQLKQVKYLFKILFVRSIIQLVNGEEEIWMLESGSMGSRLHRWERIIGV